MFKREQLVPGGCSAQLSICTLLDIPDRLACEKQPRHEVKAAGMHRASVPPAWVREACVHPGAC